MYMVFPLLYFGFVVRRVRLLHIVELYQDFYTQHLKERMGYENIIL